MRDILTFEMKSEGGPDLASEWSKDDRRKALHCEGCGRLSTGTETTVVGRKTTRKALCVECWVRQTQSILNGVSVPVYV